MATPLAMRRAHLLKQSRVRLDKLLGNLANCIYKNRLRLGSSPPVSTCALCDRRYTATMHEHHKEIAVLYHGGCPDGFGGAYAAWKKFGDTAEYIPVKYGNTPPEGLAGREVYIVDFCYEKVES